MGAWTRAIAARALSARSRPASPPILTRSLLFHALPQKNEPNGCGFWCPASKDYQAEYFAFYNYTANAVRSVDPLLSVGGPATAGLAWVPDIINFTSAGSSVPLSFVSTHSYPTDLRHMAQPNRTVYEDQIIEQAEIAYAAGLPFVLTEMSAGLNNAYDSFFAAAFVVHVASAFLGVPNVPTLSFWTFTDIFEEPGMNSVPWAETFGMQTKWGVPKPSYRAFQLLAQLPTTGVPVTVTGQPRVARRHRRGAASAATATSGTVDIITAVDDSLGTTVAVYALLSNYELNIGNTEDPSAGNPISTETVTIVFTLPPSATPSASASLQLLDSQHGCA